MTEQPAVKRNIKMAAMPNGMVQFEIEGQEAVYLTPDGANDVANKLKAMAHEARRMKFQFKILNELVLHGDKEN